MDRSLGFARGSVCSFIVWATIVTLMAGLMVASGWAQGGKQEGGGEPKAQAATEQDTSAAPQESILVWIFKAAGWFFAPLLLCMSMLVVGMVVLYAMQLRENSFAPPGFVDSFQKLYKEKKYQEAYELARTEESYLGRMLAAGIGRLSSGQSLAVEAMEDQAEDDAMRYDHQLNYLAMMGNIATMVGLLGTVVGMVKSFMQIALGGGSAPKPDKLAEGVSTALVTTVWGLSIAIPAILALTVLRNRFARLTFDADRIGSELMGRFSGQNKKSSSKEA